MMIRKSCEPERRVGQGNAPISRTVWAVGSLRNPVGPLPSSIYWRRRAVLLSLFALLALLITWIVVSGGGDGSGAGAGSGGGQSGGDGSDASSGGAGGGAVTGVGAGDALPAGSSLPNCAPGAVKLSLRSVRNSYTPGQTPAFELTARNTSGSDCKVDLGPEHAVFTITPADADDAYWASDDCVKGAGSLRYRVAAGSGITYTVKWDRRPSAPECGTPPAGSAKAGTYLVEAKAAGFEKVQTSFVLTSD